MSSNTVATPFSVIPPDKNFYGYVTGLSIQPSSEAEEIARRLLVTFEYSGAQKTWEVPTLELFDALWIHLQGNAWHRHNTDEFGYDKVWIWKDADDVWHTDLS